MNRFLPYFQNKGLNSNKEVDKIIPLILIQKDFDELFELMYSEEKHVKMKASDAIERITVDHPEFLENYKSKVFELTKTAKLSQFKWHIAQLLARFTYTENELGEVWDILTQWARAKKESRIVRVFSMQSLYDLSQNFPQLKEDLELTMQDMAADNIPSINARIRILTKKKK